MTSVPSPPVIQLSELTLSSFRLRWTAVAAGRALLLRLDDEDKDEYMQDIYRHITGEVQATSAGLSRGRALGWLAGWTELSCVAPLHTSQSTLLADCCTRDCVWLQICSWCRRMLACAYG